MQQRNRHVTWVALRILSYAILPVGAAFADDTARITELEARIEKLEAALSVAHNVPLPSEAAKLQAPAAVQPHAVLNMPNAAPGTQLFFSGFVKLDALLSKTSDGELADSGIARDLYVPGLIPVGVAAASQVAQSAVDKHESTDFNAHAKFSRIIFGTDSSLDNGRTVQSRLEGDFFGNGLGDQRFNNASGFVLRHAYVNLNNRWLVGQTWSTLMDAATLPESTDLIGPTDGTVFVRQPQVRFTSGNWMLALENPETTLTPIAGGRVSSDDNRLPDAIVRYNYKTTGGSSLGIAAIVRELAYQSTGANAIDERSAGYGLSVFGKVPLGLDDVRFALTTGKGLGRYLALNEANDAEINARGELDAIGGSVGFIAYRHLFNPQLRGSVFYARAEFNNDGVARLAQTKSSQSLHANLFYSPFPKWDLGTEIILAKRELESGDSGDLIRILASAKYSF
jgi:DcaP outer membrane protein